MESLLQGASAVLRRHWAEYLIEGALLGVFMICACTVVVCVQHPSSVIARTVRGAVRRRVIIGTLMGLTAVVLIYSPWGMRSGAHMNPGTTLTFLILGKVGVWDALFYVVSQFFGAVLGVGIARLALWRWVGHEKVNYAATVPGRRGVAAAWLGEFVIACGMMTMVLWSTNNATTAAYTGLFAGLLVAVYIAVEAPISGMSMNPARTLGSAMHARNFRGLWVYFTAPPLGMLAAAGLYVAVNGVQRVYCAKLDHPSHGDCVFDCRMNEMPGRVVNRPDGRGIQPAGDH